MSFSNINYVLKRGGADREKASPRLQSRLESLSNPPALSEFIPDGFNFFFNIYVKLLIIIKISMLIC